MPSHVAPPHCSSLFSSKRLNMKLQNPQMFQFFQLPDCFLFSIGPVWGSHPRTTCNWSSGCRGHGAPTSIPTHPSCQPRWLLLRSQWCAWTASCAPQEATATWLPTPTRSYSARSTKNLSGCRPLAPDCGVAVPSVWTVLGWVSFSHNWVAVLRFGGQWCR